MEIEAILYFLVYQSYFHVCPNHKIKYVTLTIIKAEEKIKNFQNIFDKEIHLTLIKCSIYKQPFKSTSCPNSNRLSSDKPKNIYNGSIFYILANH